MIREHFHVIDLDPGFRIGEDGELNFLKQDVLDELLEECYSKGEEEFLSFTERFGTGKNDRKIEGIILKLYDIPAVIQDRNSGLTVVLRYIQKKRRRKR